MSSRRSSPKVESRYIFSAAALGARRGSLGGIIRSGAQELGIVAARFGLGGLQREVEGRRIEDGRLGVGHGQHHRHAAGQGGGGAAVPVFLVGCAGFAHVDMRVDQAGEFDHG